MAPFIVNHPTLLNNWIVAKEIALKTIREIKDVKTEDSDLFKIYLKKSIKNITSWNTDSEYQQKKIKYAEILSVRSLIYIKKSRGPRTEPWGTPCLIFFVSDSNPSIDTNCSRFVR